jgi:hypothetical protein
MRGQALLALFTLVRASVDVIWDPGGAVRRVTLVIAVLALAGCEQPAEPPICTAIAVDALVVTVVDESAGSRICDATVVAVDGSFSAELRASGPAPECTFSGPTERPGLYEVRASRAEYEPASRSGVRVTADECHVIPVRLTLQMRKR